MELGEDGLAFSPSLEVGDDRGFLALMESLINDIYNTAKLIPRLAKGRLNYKVGRAPPPPAFPAFPAALPVRSRLPAQRSLVTYILRASGSGCDRCPRTAGGTSLPTPQALPFPRSGRAPFPGPCPRPSDAQGVPGPLPGCFSPSCDVSTATVLSTPRPFATRVPPPAPTAVHSQYRQTLADSKRGQIRFRGRDRRRKLGSPPRGASVKASFVGQ